MILSPITSPSSEREESAFRVKSDARRDPQGNTVPQPFAFATDERARATEQRRVKMREELRQREASQCTFAPQTIEGANRRAIRELLADEAHGEM